MEMQQTEKYEKPLKGSILHFNCMDDGHIYTRLSHTKSTTPTFRAEYYRTGEGGGLRTTVEDRQCLITAEHDGEGNIRK